jgi:pantothenate synthetase
LENIVMKRVREMDEVAVSVRRLLTSRGSRLVAGDRLRKALHRYEEARDSGSGRRIVKAAAELLRVVCEEYLKRK